MSGDRTSPLLNGKSESKDLSSVDNRVLSPLEKRTKPKPVVETRAQAAQKPKGAPLRLSRQVGLLLRTSEINNLTVWQTRWLQSITSCLDPQGILAASNYAVYLKDHKETYQSLHPWLEYLSRPRKGPKEIHLKPKRSMGVGYNDKGSVPDPSSRARNEANYFAWIYEADLPESWWREYGMIPLYAFRVGNWVHIPTD